MTGRTHDLAAFTALVYITLLQPTHHTTLATDIVAISANQIGGLMPDIDQPTAHLWHSIPAGSLIGRFVTPFLGGHRFISHSIAGVIIFGIISNYALTAIGKILLVDIRIVWWTFMIGYTSHLLMDIFTKEGIPLLFPLAVKFGIPPLKTFRVKTGGVVEKLIIFPLLLLINAYVFYSQYGKILYFLHHQIK